MIEATCPESLFNFLFLDSVLGKKEKEKRDF